MKNIFILICFIAYSISATAQDFPYKKMLTLSEQELIDQNFKYNKDRNQWVLKRIDGWQVLSNLLDYDANARRSRNDYIITIQNGKNDVSSIDVAFYDDEIFHTIMTFAKDNGENILETSSGNLNKLQFNYDGYSMVLQYNRLTTSVTSVRSYSYQTVVRTSNNTYNEYSFQIYTGVEPSSPFLTKEAEKEARRLGKGKKHRSAADLM